MKLFLGTTIVAGAGLVAVWAASGGPSSPVREPVAEVADPDTTSKSSPEEKISGSVGRYIESYEVFASKDPFEPLVARSGAATAAGIPTATAGGVTATFEGGSDDSGLHHTIKVVKVLDKAAVIAVDGQSYSISVGESFLDRFQLLSVADNCASILFGDDQFTLCQGEEIFK